MSENKIGRLALRSAGFLIGSLAMASVGTGVAGASTMPGGDGPTQWGESETGPSSSLVDLSHNQIPIQACHNQVPTNVLGVQVPVQDATGSLGLGVLGGSGSAPIATDSSCTQMPAQQN